MFKAASQVTDAWAVCLPEKQKFTYQGNADNITYRVVNCSNLKCLTHSGLLEGKEFQGVLQSE